MIYCVECGFENEQDARFCVSCGAELFIPSQDDETESVGAVIKEDTVSEGELSKEEPRKKGKKSKKDQGGEIKADVAAVEEDEKVENDINDKIEPEALEWGSGTVKESDPYVSPAMPSENYEAKNRTPYARSSGYVSSPYTTSYAGRNEYSGSRENTNEKTKPLSTGAYFWLQVLYCIPGLGLLMAIILSIAPSNINLKRFSRASLIFQIVVFLLLLISTLAVIIIFQQFFPAFRINDFVHCRYYYPEWTVRVG